jgi:CheY-like chemotaxis protein
VASRRWILVAEDDPLVLQLWTDTLTKAGYRVLPASNGRDAFELMHAIVPHCIVLDLHMPELSGAALLKLFLGAPVLQHIPVIVVSGFLDEHADALRAPRLHVVGCLEKPAPPAELVRAEEAALAAPPPL